MSFPIKYCIHGNNFSTGQINVSISTIQKHEAFSKFFSSRRGLLSSRRGLSSSRRGLLSSHRELKNWMQEQLVWFTYFWSFSAWVLFFGIIRWIEE